MAGDVSNIKERLLAARTKAWAELETLRAQKTLSADFMRTHLRRHILAKYMLDETTCPTDNINEIMLISLERAMHIDRTLIKETEKGGACDRATPVVTKRVLLFLALQKDLQTQLPPDALAQAETTADVADIIRLTWIKTGRISAD